LGFIPNQFVFILKVAVCRFSLLSFIVTMILKSPGASFGESSVSEAEPQAEGARMLTRISNDMTSFFMLSFVRRIFCGFLNALSASHVRTFISCAVRLLHASPDD
jgi:hypothetical protein